MDKNKLDIFITADISEKYDKEQPFESCPDKFVQIIDEKTKKEISRNGVCRRGIISVQPTEIMIKHPFEYCPKCTFPFLLKNILNVPKRFDIVFKSDSFYKKQEELLSKNFLLLEGSDFNCKLIAYYLGKKYTEQGLTAVKVSTKRYNSPDIIGDEESYNDYSGLRFADVVLFEDITKDLSEVIYTSELISRMDLNKKVIFINSPKIIPLLDKDGDLLSPDVFRYDVDSIAIKI